MQSTEASGSMRSISPGIAEQNLVERQFLRHFHGQGGPFEMKMPEVGGLGVAASIGRKAPARPDRKAPSQPGLKSVAAA